VIRRELRARGFRVVVIRYDNVLDARFGQHIDVFGGRARWAADSDRERAP
jgi:hypothetical protein